MQKRKGMKIIASMLIFMLTMTHLSIFSEVFASAVGVNFNFIQGALEVVLNGTSELVEVTVLDSDNEIIFGQATKVDGVETVEIPVTIIRDRILEDRQSITVDELENLRNIRVMVKDHVVMEDGSILEEYIGDMICYEQWLLDDDAAIFSIEESKFIPYNINGNKGVLLQAIVKSTLDGNVFPIKETEIEVKVPTINNIEPTAIKVVANSTKATNGDETGASFTEENYTYDETTNTLTINVENKVNSAGKIAWNINSEDEFLVACIYPEEAITQDNVEVKISGRNTITPYMGQEVSNVNYFVSTVTLNEQTNNLVNFSIATDFAEIGKGQIYTNYQVENKKETEYREIITADIGLAEITDKIVLEQNVDNFVAADNTKSPATQTYYKKISVDESIFYKILGNTGTISIYSGTTKIGEINAQTLEVDLTTFNINSLRIETSDPQAEGKLTFEIVKAIKGDTGYTKAEMATFNRFEINTTSTATNGKISFVEQALTEEIALAEPVSQAELIINNSNLSTLKTNENVKITAVLRTNTLHCNLYTNPVLQITLPSCIENIDIKNVEALFDTETSKLTVKSTDIIQNLDGTKTILVNLEGTQTEYTLGAVSKGVNVVITSDITVNKFTANKQEQMKMVYTNNNIIVGTTAETRETALAFNIVAPVGVITTSTMNNFNDAAETITSVSETQATGKIAILSEAKNANLSMEVINNYNNTIDNISILGRTLFTGNKDILSGSDLGTTTNMPLTSQIAVTGVDASKVAVYYSENGEATKDLADASNGWTLTPTNLANVKSYLIVLTDHSMNTADRIGFNYTMQIPANLQHNESAYENYVVYFNNNLETGTIEDKQASTKLGVTTGKGAVIEASLSSDKAETEQVLTGDIIKYTLTVKNTGTETAENVVATIDLPKELDYVEKNQETDNYKTIVMGGNQIAIQLGNLTANQTITKEIYMKAANLEYTVDTAKVEVKATITADKINGEIETKTLINTMARTYFTVMTSTITNGKNVLNEGDEFTYYIEVDSSSVYQELEDTVIELELPSELEYQSVEIKDKKDNKETDITNEENITYNNETKKLTVKLGKIEELKRKVIYLNVKVGKLEENVYDKELNVVAEISGKNVRTLKFNMNKVQIGKVGFKITQTSNIPENTHISAYEDFKYIFTIENLSNMDLYGVKFTDILPKELKLHNIVIERESGYTTDSYETDINLNFKGRETVKVEVNVSAMLLNETKTISNKAKIVYEGMETVESSSYTHIIDKYDQSIFEDPENPSNPNNQTKRIMGTIWIDENTNGQRDEEEEKVSNVEMLLFNNATGKLVTDSTGKVLRTTTDENGAYTFAGINKGKYTVIFLYDTANYSATTYRKEDVDSTMNSDAVDAQITLDGITRIAAITEEVVITDSNIYNIDLGLVSNPKFDLKLDKTVSKITLQDAKGTNVYEFNDSKLAKKDLVGKQVAGTTIIVEYKIKVSNEGAISGFVKKIADYMPEEMKFSSELNKDWYTSGNGILYNSSLANTIINPGESKEVTLTLTKKMTEDNLGLYHNEAEIYEAYNDLGIEDTDSTEGNKLSNEDDISSADVLITVKTGEVILFIGLTLTIVAIIGSGVYLIKKKVLK